MADNAHADSSAHRVVTVKLDNEVFGFPIETIEGIVPWEPLTHVPKMPDYMAGVVSIRGSVLAVIDLRTRLGLDRAEATASNRIVIAHIGEQRVGLIVDGVEQVAWVPEASVDRACHEASGAAAEFIEGVARLDDALVLLLRPDSFLSEEEVRRVAKAA